MNSWQRLPTSCATRSRRSGKRRWYPRAEGASDAQKRWSHDVISRQVHHMSLLLDDLLDVSRITRGTLELRLEMADLRDIVDAAVEAARPSIDAKRHGFSVQLPDQPLQILVDPLRMAQILSNLLTNAAKYTDPAGQIELRAHYSDEQVTVVVTDSGIGIPPLPSRACSRCFHKSNRRKTAPKEGLGIGLALAKGLVELHGGSIEAQSAGIGRGSQFIMRLPRRAQDIKSTSDPARGRHAPAAPRRILVADDNRDAAESLAMLLQIDGHELRVEYDGRGRHRGVRGLRAASCAIGHRHARLQWLRGGAPGAATRSRRRRSAHSPHGLGPGTRQGNGAGGRIQSSLHEAD